MTQGIYQIRNIINNKKYIGSSNNIEKRFYSHLWLLKRNEHHSIHLQRAWNKNPNNFVYEVVEIINSRKNLITKEQHFIDLYQTANPLYGYNICLKANSPEGKKCRRQTINKIRKATQGINNPRARLDDNQVIEILNLLQKKKTATEISKMFNITRTAISDIKTGRTWAHINRDEYSFTTDGLSKLTRNEAEVLRQEFVNGTTREELMKRYHLSRSGVNKILRRMTYK